MSAQFTMGWCFCKGDMGMPLDFALAASWIRKAASQRFAHAAVPAFEAARAAAAAVAAAAPAAAVAGQWPINIVEEAVVRRPSSRRHSGRC